MISEWRVVHKDRFQEHGVSRHRGTSAGDAWCSRAEKVRWLVHHAVQLKQQLRIHSMALSPKMR